MAVVNLLYQYYVRQFSFSGHIQDLGSCLHPCHQVIILLRIFNTFLFEISSSD
jgi:hypothetical protein